MNCLSTSSTMLRLVEAVAIVLHGVFIFVISGDTLCDAVQYIEIGKTQSIKCTFNDDFANILWYNYSDVFDKKPLIALTKSGKSGIGLESGEYDVYQNGTLIINKVSELHETTFTAVAFSLSEAFPSTHNINVTVFALPVPPYPLIKVQECSRDNQLCFLELGDDIDLQCYINGSRPVIQLSWYLKTFGEDEEELQSSFTHSSTHGVHQSISTLKNLELDSALLKILTCRAYEHEFKLDRDEAFLLVKKKSNVDHLNVKPVSVWFERSKPATISCLEGDFMHIVWEKNSPSDYTTISFGSFIGEGFVSFSTNNYLLSNTGALTIPNVEINHEGTYICTRNNGSNESLRVYNLKVYVRPDPPYPIVDNCNHNQNCIVPAEREGNLTCTLRGIYPIVELEWQILLDDNKDAISFINEYSQVTKTTTSTADVTLTVQYKVNPSALNRLYLVCKPKGETVEDYSRTVELLLPEDPKENTFFNLSITVSRGILTSGIILLTLTILIGVVFVCWCKRVYKGCCRKQNETTEIEQGESQELLENPRYKGEKNKEGLFIKNLTIAYNKQYKAIQPIPSMAKLVYSLDEIFVDSGFVLAHTEEIEIRKRFRGKSCSFKEIYQTILPKQNFLLVKGEPGYGKSMFAMKIAHDWCKAKLTDTYDIVIFLSLKSLQNADSLYAAIKDNLMPNECNFTNKDIEKILKDSKSVLILCDGLDEYSQRDSDFSNTLDQTFKHFKVVLTVRSMKSLPCNVSPSSTILKLEGFNKDAQCEYISNVHTIGKAENTDPLEFFNQFSPDVQDLFQVPLLFALFVHLQTDANLYHMSSSVTKLFNKVIECFHMHYRSKDDTKNEQKDDTSQRSLGKLAFRGLKHNRLKFSRDELANEIGNNLVEYYMKIGILVDEQQKYNDMGEGSANSKDKNQQYNVTFFHKLFCEWYAAYRLVEMFTGWNDVNIEKHLENSDSILNSLDIYELHYLFRFACGLNTVAATNIIKWMESVDGCEKFIILCTLEQLGSTDSIMNHIEKITSKEIQIVKHDTKLQKRSAIQLLQIASNAKKTISSLWLVDCLQPFKEDRYEVVLEDNIQVPVLRTLENLYIEQSEPELNEKDVTNIIKYCCQCTKLQKVTFANCALPMKCEKEALINFCKHKFEVLWHPSAMFYSLDRDTGGWKDGGRLLSEGQYQSEVDVFRDCYFQ